MDPEKYVTAAAEPSAAAWVAPIAGDMSLSRLIAQELTTAIVEGRMPPGVKLKEEELAAAFGTSRTPVREAFRLLESEELVTMLPRRGVFVTELSANDAAEVYVVRSNLGGLAVRIATSIATNDDFADLEAIVERLADAAVERDSLAFVRTAIEFDRAVETITGNQLLSQLLSRLSRKSMRLRYAAPLNAQHLDESAHAHQVLLATMRNQDRDGAELLMRRIIASAWDNLAERYFELDESARSELASALTDRDGEESLPASAAKP